MRRNCLLTRDWLACGVEVLYDHIGRPDIAGREGAGQPIPREDANITSYSACHEHANRWWWRRRRPGGLGRHGELEVGAPWAGCLQHPTQLPPGDGYLIRRPARSFGTETTIEYIERAIGQTLEAFPDVHVLPIGDISAESGGRITEHHSHQSGRDIDVGLFYLDKPDDYPANFVHADEDNLDCAATFKLLESFLASASEDGGVQMIFLDFEVQGILYRWAQEHGVSERRLERIFQYPHGRDSSEGLVRHEPNHDNHMHVRFQCASDDTACH